MQPTFLYGVELETLFPSAKVEAITSEIRGKLLPYIFGHDGSISGLGTGVEIKCARGISLGDLERTIPALCKILRDNGVKVNSTCGYHIHMSHPSFTTDVKLLQRIYYVWTAIEDVLISTQPKERYGSSYTQRILHNYVSVSDREKHDAHLDVNRFISNRSTRYVTLNVQSLRKYGTLECRLHTGTTNPEKILAWARLMTAIYTYAMMRYNVKEIDTLFDMIITDEKVDAVFNLLELDKETKNHLKNRIDKFGFKLLQIQQVEAHKSLILRKELTREDKEYVKLSKEKSTLQEKLYQQEKQIGVLNQALLKRRDELQKRLHVLTWGWSRANTPLPADLATAVTRLPNRQRPRDPMGRFMSFVMGEANVVEAPQETRQTRFNGGAMEWSNDGRTWLPYDHMPNANNGVNGASLAEAINESRRRRDEEEGVSF